MTRSNRNTRNSGINSENYESEVYDTEYGVFGKIEPFSDFFSSRMPIARSPDYKRIDDLILEGEKKIARIDLEKWIDEHPDDFEALSVILELIDPSEEPFIHSYYSKKMLYLDENSTFHLSTLFSTTYSFMRKQGDFSINSLIEEYTNILSEYPDFSPEEITRAAILSGRKALETHPSASKDINLSLLRSIGEENPDKAVELSYLLGPDSFDERGLKSSIIYSKRSKNLLYALILTDYIEKSVWASDQKSEIYSKLLGELSTDDPKQVDNALKFASIPKKSLKNLALGSGEDRSTLYRQIFIQFKDSDGPLRGLALEAGLYHQRNTADVKFLDILSNRLGRAKFSDSALEATEKAVRISPTESRLERYIQLLSKIDNSDNGSSRDTLRDRFYSLMDEIKIAEEGVVDWYKILEFSLLRNSDSPEVTKFSPEDLHTDTGRFVRLLARSIFNEGDIDRAISTLSALSSESDRRTLDFWNSLSELDHLGLDWPRKSGKSPSVVMNTCAYMLHNSAPIHSGGYATRSHGLMLGLSKNRWIPKIISRLGYPNDLKTFDGMETKSFEVFDGLEYYRLLTEEEGYGQIPLAEYLEAYSIRLEERLLEIGVPGIIHGASNFMNGYAAVSVAKRLGVKSIYEVRGLWEVTRASRQKSWEGSQHYKLLAKLEAEVASEADHVFCITNALANEMERRGVDRNKISILPNGVNSTLFKPLDRDMELAKELGLMDKTVIGYVGSMVMYEGLELLVEAFSLMPQDIRDQSSLLFVGDGASMESVKRSCDKFGLSKNEVIFTGRVPHDQVSSYYSIIDIAPIPRTSLPVTEMVSPMKPFEAMSMEKLVIVSNVDALDEIIFDDSIGRKFEKNNVLELAEVLSDSVRNPELRAKLENLLESGD